MFRWFQNVFFFLLVVLLVPGTASADGSVSDLSISLAAEKPIVVGDQAILVRIKISNDTNETIFVPQSQLPQSKISTPLFSVKTSDGRPAPYVGAMVKWAPDALRKKVKFAPNTQREYVVELSRSYSFNNGSYIIEYVGLGIPPKGVDANSKTYSRMKLSSPIVISVQGRADTNVNKAPRTLRKLDQKSLAPLSGQVRTKTYTTNTGCSTKQIKATKSAANGALAYARNAYLYFYKRTSATATNRYLTWFGYPDASYWDTAYGNFARIYSALYYETINFDCSCTDEGVYAYVYTNDPFNIYLCQAYWSAPLKGTDSKAGTIIHELSHFDIVGGTDDWAYGQSDARLLAQSYPAYAVNNADNHEYFAENKPRLR